MASTAAEYCFWRYRSLHPGSLSSSRSSCVASLIGVPSSGSYALLVRGSGGEEYHGIIHDYEHQLQALHTVMTHLLPPTRAVRLTDVTVEPPDVRLQLTTTAPAACCPRCAVPSCSVHSRYQRISRTCPGVRLLSAFGSGCANSSAGIDLHAPHLTERVPELVAAYAARPSADHRAPGDRRGPRRPGWRTARASASDCPRGGHAVAAGAPSAPASIPPLRPSGR